MAARKLRKKGKTRLPEVEVLDSEQGQSRSNEARELIRWDPVQQYLAEVRRFPALSRDEEHDLAMRYYQSGDKSAAYKLIMSNLRLVVIVAREYQKHYQNILDLIQEGNIGLLEAVKKYDPFRGIRFPSYAVYWIRAYILRHLINSIRLVKIGTTQAQRKLFFNLQREKTKLEAEGFTPEARLLAERLNVRESDVIEMEQRLALPELSVDAPVNTAEGPSDYHSILPDLGENTEELIAKEQFSDVLRKAVEEFKAGLDAKECAIVEQRLFTEEPVTLQAIANQFGLSRERIRQLESRLKTRLKQYLSDKLQLGEDGEVSIGK